LVGLLQPDFNQACHP